MREQIPSILLRFTAGIGTLSNGYESGRILPMKNASTTCISQRRIADWDKHVTVHSRVFFSSTLLTFLKEVRQRDEPHEKQAPTQGGNPIPI
jgi:hypothetical protein